MKVNYNWLKEYLDGNLPEPKELGTILDDHSYEVEAIENLPGGNAALDIDILPNRAADSLCHYGVAREIAAVLEIPFKGRVIADLAVQPPSTIFVEILEDKKCTRYIGKKINNIEVKESPEGLRDKLESLGQKSINNVVDTLNYVMFDMGQPMHAFDADKVVGKIVVRNAEEGEKITTLDNKEIELKKEDLVIADDEKALAIAGVKGGKAAEVTKDTKNIILEAANFNQAAIRHTSRRLNLITDASKRFENGVAPEIADRAMGQAAELIKELAGNDKTEIEESADIYDKKRGRYRLGVSVLEINKLLGTSMSSQEVENIWKRLGFSYRVVNPIEEVASEAQKYVGVPYKYGASITYDAPRYFDCSSFTSYLYANAGVSIPRMTIDQFIFGEVVERTGLEAGDIVFSDNSSKHGDDSAHKESKEFMPGTEVSEGISHNGIYLGNGKIIHASGKWHKGEVIIEDLDTSLAFSDIRGVRRMASNNERFVIEVPFERLDLRIKEDLIEEVGRLYGLNNIEPKLPENAGEKPEINKTLYWKEKIKDILTDAGFDEVYTYSFAEEGEVELLNPLSKELPYMRPDLVEGLKKSVALNIKNKPILGLDKIRIFEIGKVFEKDREFLQLGVAIEKNDKNGLPESALEVGVGDAITRATYYENNDVKILLINVDDLIAQLSGSKSYDWQNVNIANTFQPISNYPFVLRDIAAWMPIEEGKEALFEIIKAKAGNLLKRADLFDTFEKGEQVSYAYHLVFQAEDRTLTDAEVNAIMEEIYDEAKSRKFDIR